jgi:hypothetical protein
VEVKDIIEVLEKNNFPSEKQCDLLKILDLALLQKDYSYNIHNIIERKIQILQQLTEKSEKDNQNVASIKVRSVVILEMLKQMQLGTAHNDLTKICKLIAFLTGNSYRNIYNELQKGVHFSKFHSKHIDEINKILEELNASISIDKNKQY